MVLDSACFERAVVIAFLWSKTAGPRVCRTRSPLARHSRDFEAVPCLVRSGCGIIGSLHLLGYVRRISEFFHLALESLGQVQWNVLGQTDNRPSHAILVILLPGRTEGLAQLCQPAIQSICRRS